MVREPYDPFNISAVLADFDAQFAEMQAACGATRERYRARLDVPYGPGSRQRLDLFFPPGEAAGRPIHMFVHGGYWRAQVKEDYAFVAEGAIAAGAIAAIIEYTLLPGVRHDRQVNDVRAAAAWLRTHAAEFGGDGTKLSASGHSAGGHLAGYLGLSAPGEVAEPSGVRSLLMLSGIYDLEPITTSYLQRELFLTPGEVARWSPLNARPSGDVHYEIAVGGRETPPFHEQGAAMAAMLRAAGTSVGEVTPAGLDHMSLVRELGRPGLPMAEKLREAIEQSAG